MPRERKRKVGRPKHADRPKALFTTVPTSVHKQLGEIATMQGRSKSEILSELIRAYHNRLGK